MEIYLLFFLIVLLESLALYSVKKASVDQKNYLYISIVCYGLIPIFIYLILRKGNMVSTTNITWNILSTLYGLFIGLVLFSEHIGNLQMYGIVLGTLGLVLIFKKEV
jgi:uncharacterized membrane protein